MIEFYAARVDWYSLWIDEKIRNYVEGQNGRQTRPANDVGRSHRRAKRAPLSGRGTAPWGSKRKTPLCDVCDWAPPQEGSRYCARCAPHAPPPRIQADEGLRRGEAPHGEAPPDET